MQTYTHETVKTLPHLPIYCDQYETYRQMSPSHWHDHLEIIYIIEGELQIFGNETNDLLGKDEFYVVNSNKIHGTRSSGTIKALLIQIPFSYMEAFIPDYEHVRFQECYRKKQTDHMYGQMKSLLQSFARIFQKKGTGYEFLLMARLEEFLYLLYTNYSHMELDVEKESRQAVRLKEVLQYIATSYHEPISLREAAHMATLSTEYFCRMFKRCMGVTFLEYVNLVRIDHIHEELLATDDSITEILERNGFTNYKVFSRMFKEQFGMTPSELRKLSV